MHFFLWRRHLGDYDIPCDHMRVCTLHIAHYSQWICMWLLNDCLSCFGHCCDMGYKGASWVLMVSISGPSWRAILQPFVHFASRKSFILVGWLFSLLFQGLNMTSWLPMCPLCTKVEKNFIACFEVFWTCMVIQCVPSVATSCKIFSRVVTGWILLPIKRIDTSLILYRVDVATSYWKRWWLNRVTKRWYYYHCVHDSFAFSCTLSSTVGLATTIFPFSLSLPWVDCYLTLELSFDLVVIYGHSGGYFQQGFMSE